MVVMYGRVYQLSPGLRPSAATSALRECYRPAPSAIESPIAGDRDREQHRNFHHTIPANAYRKEEVEGNLKVYHNKRSSADITIIKKSLKRLTWSDGK